MPREEHSRHKMLEGFPAEKPEAERQSPKPMRGTEYFKEPEGPFREWPEMRLVEEHLALRRA